MRVLALVLATLLLAAPLAAGQTNNTTSSDENQTATDQEGGTNDTSQADAGDEEGNVTLPDRSGHIPWAGVAVGLIIFAAAVLLSRVTYHGHD